MKCGRRAYRGLSAKSTEIHATAGSATAGDGQTTDANFVEKVSKPGATEDPPAANSA